MMESVRGISPSSPMSPPPMDIGTPTNFKPLTQVRVNEDGTFEGIEGLPDDMVKVKNSDVALVYKQRLSNDVFNYVD